MFLLMLKNKSIRKGRISLFESGNREVFGIKPFSYLLITLS